MLIETGTQVQLVSETTSGAGTTSRDGSIKSDSLVATLFVNSISPGASLDVSVYTLTDTGKQVLLFSFPTVSGSTTSLLLKKAGISLQRFLVVTTYSGIVSYEIYIRAVGTAGESSTSILGSNSFTTDGISIGTSPTILIPDSLTDRNGLVIKNWKGGGNLFVSEDQTKLTSRAYPMAQGDAVAMDVGAGVTIYAVSDSGVIDVRIAQSGT